MDLLEIPTALFAKLFHASFVHPTGQKFHSRSQPAITAQGSLLMFQSGVKMVFQFFQHHLEVLGRDKHQISLFAATLVVKLSATSRA